MKSLKAHSGQAQGHQVLSRLLVAFYLQTFYIWSTS